MKNIFFLPIIFFLIQGCTRAANTDSSRIQIQLPSESTLSSKALGSISVAEPETLDQINCYGVFVGGPDESLRRNVCTLGTKSESPSLRSGGVVFFGDWMAAVPAGKKFEMEVPSGVDRVIHLVGFKTDSADDCNDFKINGVPSEDKMSSAYLLGSVGRLNLKPDETVTVPVAMKLDSGKTITGCIGPDAPKGKNDDSGGSYIPYLRFEGIGSYNADLKVDEAVVYTCYAFQPSLYIGQGIAWTDRDRTGDIHIDVTALSGLGLFYSGSGCTNPTVDLVIPVGQNKSAVTYYFKSNVSVTGNLAPVVFTGNTKGITGAQQTIKVRY